ncbi:hypothetical protein BU24DRAFT_452141 [Aaosphaeria arxii CBS 175.79]|uniref:Uncharacterized protein n=1 Tax=Aaosphaeria arxii CBS 175.79 TaxID=1450172 RepID=A0A6A5XKB1_9PLEO|nr:uncharacterized protein BU24DRAFT_452141 [Aaosphaeria arxii CBS 175.79]KAF2013190.1 hypothetical protein BU24DRAFT_452141 [Aaosphaeria arxii CBS 175.79]
MLSQRIYSSARTVWCSSSQRSIVAAGCQCASFHQSAHLCEESSAKPTPPRATTKNSQPSQTRRSRNNAAASQVANLGRRDTGSPSNGPNTTRPLIKRTSNTAPPPGKLVKAPANLRLTRNAPKTGVQGPNLNGRNKAAAGQRPLRPGNRKPAGGPARRDPKLRQSASEEEDAENQADKDLLPEGMVQHLLRLQRKEWDRTPYQPKYTKDSKAALDLIENGKKLFQGESPLKKEPSKIDKRLGIVGMHGA